MTFDDRITPGPWHVKRNKARGTYEIANDHVVFAWAFRRRDAEFLASAADLVEVVRLAAEIGCHERAVDHLRERARAALAKADGIFTKQP